MAEHKNYLIYLSGTDMSSADIDSQVDRISKNFGGDHTVKRLNSSTSIVVKVSASYTVSDVLGKAGLDNKGNNRGIVIEFVNGSYNGWYSPDLWDFIRKPLVAEENRHF